MTASLRDVRSARREALRAKTHSATVAKPSRVSKSEHSPPTISLKKEEVTAAADAATAEVNNRKSVVTDAKDRLDQSSETPEYSGEPLSPASELDEMTDDDLQRYFSEFEAASQGEYPEPEPEAVQPTLPSPEVEAEKRASQPVSPLLLDNSPDFSAPADFSQFSFDSLDCSFPLDGEEHTVDDKGIEEYISYGEDNTDTTDTGTEYLMDQRRPFCLYRTRTQVSPVSTTFNPNKRTLLAALETVAADSQYVSRDDYIRSVLVAAESLNQRSMVSGLARQTMAPALGTSH